MCGEVQDPETAALVRRLEAERLGLGTSGQVAALRMALQDATQALLAVTEERDHLADMVHRLCAAEISEPATGRPRLYLVGNEPA